MPAEMLGHGYYQTTGTGPDLMENAKNAVRDMIDWLVTDQQVSLHEAYTLCSVAGDLKINETVDLPNWLVSMTLRAASSPERDSGQGLAQARPAAPGRDRRWQN